jgi:murein DD-endopeptidase MepM/ murein hydrolase activator NlpD/SH3-like domain-containing protein
VDGRAKRGGSRELGTGNGALTSPSAFRLPPSALLLALFLAACKDGVPFFEPARPTSAHERYADGLERAGLGNSALARDWLAAARSSIRQPVVVTLPFREAGYFAASEARAVSYAVTLRDGQRLAAIAETTGTPLTIFLDLFEQTADTANPLELVASLDSATGSGARLTYEARRDGTYVLRVQPELLRSGAFTLTVSTEPSLAFPVSGKSNKAVQSFFGAERDAGARLHKGIDIFAPRGTPALAAARGVVRSISPNNLGGNVVWLSDYDRGQTIYYAHLDRHNVVAGQSVNIGDTLGFVGNTGNARTTPPHLHFGIYRRGQGAVDPYPFVYRSAATPSPVTADTSELGALARTRVKASVTAAPEARAVSLTTIAAATPLQIDGAAGVWFRVRLPDGRAGYVNSRLVESTRNAVRRTAVASGTPLRDRPASDAAIIATATGESLPVVGEFADYALVETANGRTAWVPSGRQK